MVTALIKFVNWVQCVALIKKESSVLEHPAQMTQIATLLYVTVASAANN